MKKVNDHLISRITAGLILAVILSLAVESDGMSKDMPAMLHFVVPFSIETYMPITMENIEADSSDVWIMKDHDAAKKLMQILQAKPSFKALHEKEIRLKANFGSSTGVFFLDKDGVVFRKDDGQHFELSGKELEQVEHLLEQMMGIVDIRAYNRFHESLKMKREEGNRSN